MSFATAIRSDADALAAAGCELTAVAPGCGVETTVEGAVIVTLCDDDAPDNPPGLEQPASINAAVRLGKRARHRKLRAITIAMVACMSDTNRDATSRRRIRRDLGWLKRRSGHPT